MRVTIAADDGHLGPDWARWLRWGAVIGSCFVSGLAGMAAAGGDGGFAQGIGFAIGQMAVILLIALAIGRGMRPERRWIAWTVGGVLPCLLAAVRLVDAQQGRSEFASGLREIQTAMAHPDSARSVTADSTDFGGIVIRQQRAMTMAMVPYQQATALVADTAWTRLLGTAEGRVELRRRLSLAGHALGQSQALVVNAMAHTREQMEALQFRNPVFAGSIAGYDRGAAQASATFAAVVHNDRSSLGIMDSMVQFVDRDAVRMGARGPMFTTDEQVAAYNDLYLRLQRHVAVADSLRRATIETQARGKASLDSAIQAEGLRNR
jgi:hypothetical protein